MDKNYFSSESPLSGCFVLTDLDAMGRLYEDILVAMSDEFSKLLVYDSKHDK